MARFFKPQFSLQYMNGVFVLVMNPQMSKLLMDEIKNQGENVNLTAMIQIPFKGAEMLRDLCTRSSDFFLRNLGGQFDDTLEQLREKRLAYETQHPLKDDLDEEPLDDAAPSYGRSRK